MKILEIELSHKKLEDSKSTGRGQWVKVYKKLYGCEVAKAPNESTDVFSFSIKLFEFEYGNARGIEKAFVAGFRPKRGCMDQRLFSPMTRENFDLKKFDSCKKQFTGYTVSVQCD